jgi:hypothetical protein
LGAGRSASALCGEKGVSRLGIDDVAPVKILGVIGGLGGGADGSPLGVGWSGGRSTDGFRGTSRFAKGGLRGMFPGGLGTCELVSVCLSTEDGLNGGLEIVVFEEAAVEGPVFAEEEVPVFLRVGIPPAKRPPSFCPEEPTPESFPDLESAPAEVDFSIEGADLSTVTVFLSFVPC